MAVSLTTVHI